MSSFWDMVSRCERPRHMLYVLPSFLRREPDCEEAAVFEAGAGGKEPLARPDRRRARPGDVQRPLPSARRRSPRTTASLAS